MNEALKSRNRAMLWCLLGLMAILYGVAFVRMSHLVG
jgi:hypothetical protein